MSIANIEGRAFDGSCNSIMIGNIEIPTIKASYADKLDKGTSKEMGSQGIGTITRGTYSADDAKITMLSHTFRTRLMPLFPQVGAGNVAFNICVIKVHPELGSDSDLLLDCYCINLSASIEQSNKADEVEIGWKIGRGIQWTDTRIQLFDDGTASLATGGFSISAGISFNF